ncbi:unnamed protein product [Rotaria sordida]|uniref:Uncharacterized protein n=1 Tax=Rotaria sordida TaxID=392033 RepID=A0A815JYM3_9BILA|nr:unnamed protein product [Rotaria sordida]
MFIKNVWLPYRNYHKTTPSNDDSTANVQPVVNSSENEHVYRMPGLLGDAREYIIERFYRNENSEDDSE